MLISSSTLPGTYFTKGRSWTYHRAPAVSHRLLTAEAVEYCRGGNSCLHQISNSLLTGCVAVLIVAQWWENYGTQQCPIRPPDVSGAICKFIYIHIQNVCYGECEKLVNVSSTVNVSMWTCAAFQFHHVRLMLLLGFKFVMTLGWHSLRKLVDI
jgi:hypothetical protein